MRITQCPSGVGTGGTISGISRHIKHAKGKAILSVAVEPTESPVIDRVEKVERAEAVAFARRLVQEEGIGA